MTRHRGRSRVYASALMPITVRGRVAVATRTRSRPIVRWPCSAGLPSAYNRMVVMRLCIRKYLPY